MILNVRKSSQLLIQQIFPGHHSQDTRGLGHRDPGCSNRFIYPMFNMMPSMPGRPCVHMYEQCILCMSITKHLICCDFMPFRFQHPSLSHGFSSHPHLVPWVLRDPTVILTKRFSRQPNRRVLPFLTVHIIN